MMKKTCPILITNLKSAIKIAQFKLANTAFPVALIYQKFKTDFKASTISPCFFTNVLQVGTGS